MNRITYTDLIYFCTETLKKAGLDDESVRAVSKGLCETSLRGVDSHGIRLLHHYVRSAENGRKNPKPKYFFKKKFPSLGYLDADNAFGHAAGMRAIDHCIEMARIQGIGAVAVFNSSHPGAMASMALKAARKGYIAFAFTHADSLLLSHDGSRPFFGTNPICFAAPRENSEEPYCLDMATSMISWNKLLNQKSQKQSLGENFAADKYGEMTKDPSEAVSLFPAGSYKGFGLASMVEILCGVYTGMKFGREMLPMYKSSIEKPRKLGQFYIALRIDGCLEKKLFLERMKKLSDVISKEPSRPNKRVMLPNDPEIEAANYRLINGIPLDQTTLKNLIDISEKYSIKLKLIN